jgi:hypothetical protein
MMTRWENWFLKTAAVVLLATGSAKLVSVFGAARVLAMNDPIIGLSFRRLMSAVGAVELVTALFCLSTLASTRLKLGLVAWLSTIFLVYRFGLWFVRWHHPCGCMGSLAAILHLSDKAADNIMKGLLAYMLIGSYAILFWLWKQGREVGSLPAPLPVRG